jgi:hypothetical protein
MLAVKLVTQSNLSLRMSARIPAVLHAGRAFAFAGGGVQIGAFCVRMHDSALAVREKVMAG